MKIKDLYQHYLSATGVSIDTRTIQEGQMFFGLVGERFNGSSYAQQALEAGASKVVVQDLSKDDIDDDRYIFVDDALETLQLLSKYHRAQLKIPVIGITGSNGKTTTKELLYAVLSTQYKVSATKGNYNNHIGVPITLLNADPDAEILIVEMGTNQPGDIDELCDLGVPNHGIITNIGASHLEGLVSKEGVYQEKRRLFDHVHAIDGTFFLNLSDELLCDIKNTSNNTIDYHAYKGAYGELTIVDSDNEHLTLKLDFEQETYDIKTQLSGDYNIENISACLAIGYHFDVSTKEAILAIESYRPSNMRSQVIHSKKNVIVLDAYNANPTSMKASVLTFEKDERHVLMILGDMLELGEKSEQYHREVADLLTSLGLKAILVGRAFAKLDNSAFQTFDNVHELIDSDELSKIEDHHILIKASRGVQLEKIVPYL